jgi:hypothetical protein
VPSTAVPLPDVALKSGYPIAVPAGAKVIVPASLSGVGLSYVAPGTIWFQGICGCGSVEMGPRVARGDASLQFIAPDKYWLTSVSGTNSVSGDKTVVGDALFAIPDDFIAHVVGNPLLTVTAPVADTVVGGANARSVTVKAAASLPKEYGPGQIQFVSLLSRGWGVEQAVVMRDSSLTIIDVRNASTPQGHVIILHDGSATSESIVRSVSWAS